VAGFNTSLACPCPCLANSRGGCGAKAWCLLIHAEASPYLSCLSRGAGRKPGASSYTRKRPPISRVRRNYGGQGESLVPPHARGSVCLSREPGRKPGVSSYTRKHYPLTGGRRKPGASAYARRHLPLSRVCLHVCVNPAMFKPSVGSGMEYMVSNPVRPIRTVHFGTPTNELPDSSTGSQSLSKSTLGFEEIRATSPSDTEFKPSSLRCVHV